MKQQFKFNPLATAILALLFSSSMQSSFAASAEDLSLSNKNTTTQDNTNETYPGQRFFSQYYVDKSSPQAQKRNPTTLSSAFCRGTWITPIDPETKSLTPQDSPSTITADYGYYDPAGNSVLEGNVLVDQEGRSLRADKVTLDQSQTHAQAEGHVEMAQNGLLALSDHVNYDLQSQLGDLNNSFYIAEQQHAHGFAQTIKRTSPDVAIFYNASYSTCPPEQKTAWKIKARELKLNQETGRGVSKNTKIYIKDTHVASLPYFNFPIDDRRATGLLIPTFGFTNDGGFQFNAPVYLNLAPNYDAIVTPAFLGSRGAMINGEFRYLTEHVGQGQISGGFLPSDPLYNNQDRKEFHLKHNWALTPQWSTNLDFNYASDKDYFSDLKSSLPNSVTYLNLYRAWQMSYANGIPGLKAQFKVEDYQTLDKTIADKDRPYTRLPQLLLNYIGGNPLGLEYEFNNDTAYFTKTSQNNQLVDSGTRLYNQMAVRYNYRTPWAYAIPEVSVRSLNTYSNSTDTSKDLSVVVPQVTLDTGLIFEKQGKYLQTISPRFFYAYAPYRNQNNAPNFDSISTTINYSQLFTPYRFSGHDRLEDNNFATLGVTYRLFDDIGLNRLQASIGQSYFLSERRVQLANDVASKDKSTAPMVSLSSQLSQHFSIGSNASWLANGKVSYNDLQMYYTGDKGNLYNLGYFYRKDLPNQKQQNYQQAVVSFIQPLYEQWRIIGHAQYDLNYNVGREYLLGINYESCCWSVTAYGRSYYNDLDNINDPNVTAKRAIMIEFTLKGLGGFNHKLSTLLQQKVVGFNQINQSWTQR